MSVNSVMGAAAGERCDDFGWHPRGPVDPSLVVEIAQHPRFGLGHAWSRSADYHLTTAPSRTYLVLTVEGRCEFDVDGSVVTTEPGSLILLDGGTPTTARTLRDTARFLWHLEPAMLDPRRSRFGYGEPVPTGGTAVRTLTSMTSALLAAPRSSNEVALRHHALAFENLLVAVLEEGSPRRGDGTHRDGLFMAAVAAIETHFHDPAFAVPRLARELSVSVRTLHDTFRGIGSTPRREIERRRIAEANQLYATQAVSAAEVAARAGFTSSRQLARALGRAAPLPQQPDLE